MSEETTEVKPPIRLNAWVNVYPTELSTVYETKDEADKAADPDRIECVELVGYSYK